MINRAAVASALLLMLCAGCVPMSAKPDRAALPILVQRIQDNEIYLKCAKAWPLWQHILAFPILPLGCAEYLPAHGACIIWIGETSSAAVLEHEKKHCLGYDHLF